MSAAVVTLRAPPAACSGAMKLGEPTIVPLNVISLSSSRRRARAFRQRRASLQVAVVGLGAGATACYAEPTEQWTFYEINPAVVGIARNTNYFSYLQCFSKTAVRVIEREPVDRWGATEVREGIGFFAQLRSTLRGVRRLGRSPDRSAKGNLAHRDLQPVRR